MKMTRGFNFLIINLFIFGLMDKKNIFSKEIKNDNLKIFFF